MPAELSLGAGMQDLARLYPWLEDAAAGLDPKLRHDMHVALEEAVVNVAMHALAPDAQDGITIRLRVLPAAAVLEIEDPGPAFDPTSAPEAAPRDKASPGGLGLRLLRHFCGDISYQRTGQANRLTLRFPL